MIKQIPKQMILLPVCYVRFAAGRCIHITGSNIFPKYARLPLVSNAVFPLLTISVQIIVYSCVVGYFTALNLLMRLTAH